VGSFVFVFLLFWSRVVCIRNVFRTFHCAEVGCNSYIRDINLFLLSKKSTSNLNFLADSLSRVEDNWQTP
jgi:hypothetical protein